MKTGVTSADIESLANEILDKGLDFDRTPKRIYRTDMRELIQFSEAIMKRSGLARIVELNKRYADLLRQIAYPRRGTEEGRMDIYDAAKLIQCNFSSEQLNGDE